MAAKSKRRFVPKPFHGKEDISIPPFLGSMRYTWRMNLVALVIITTIMNVQAGCGRWVYVDNTDYLSDPIFDVNENEADQVLNSTENETDTAIVNASDDSNANIDADESNSNESLKPISDVSGQWYIELNDTNQLISIAYITVDQNGNVLNGMGNLSFALKTLPIMANGSIENDTIYMDVTNSDNGNTLSQTLYHLNMLIDDITMPTRFEGSYSVYQNQEFSGKGFVKAVRVKL